MGNTTHICMTYGSFFKGIAQREINPGTRLKLRKDHRRFPLGMTNKEARAKRPL